jgi:hypothetical protein
VFTDVGDTTESSPVPVMMEKAQKCPFRWFSHSPLSGQKVYWLCSNLATAWRNAVP